eukprot:GHVN01012996.1.p1 GENE.GHVN01012996.1~~GHVN01012996.1.p1  ORF type:complete len:494 (+),score=69.69 GHVN01012996.1:48-1529(+)
MIAGGVTPRKEARRWLALKELRVKYGDLCESYLKLTPPPRESFNRWLFERRGKLTALDHVDPLLPSLVTKRDPSRSLISELMENADCDEAAKNGGTTESRKRIEKNCTEVAESLEDASLKKAISLKKQDGVCNSNPHGQLDHAHLTYIISVCDINVLVCLEASTVYANAHHGDGYCANEADAQIDDTAESEHIGKREKNRHKRPEKHDTQDLQDKHDRQERYCRQDRQGNTQDGKHTHNRQQDRPDILSFPLNLLALRKLYAAFVCHQQRTNPRSQKRRRVHSDQPNPRSQKRRRVHSHQPQGATEEIPNHQQGRAAYSSQTSEEERLVAGCPRSGSAEWLRWANVQCSPNTWDTFVANVFCVVCRYDALCGPGLFEGRGLQAAVPTRVVDVLIASPFNLQYEAFASPFNRHVNLIYYSLFVDVDHQFGSLGNFFHALAQPKHLPSGSYLVNPPFDERLMLELAVGLIRVRSNKSLSTPKSLVHDVSMIFSGS